MIFGAKLTRKVMGHDSCCHVVGICREYKRLAKSTLNSIGLPKRCNKKSNFKGFFFFFFAKLELNLKFSIEVIFCCESIKGNKIKTIAMKSGCHCFNF